MLPDSIVLATLITLLSIIQSIFGMGILVFGTPTLLLMGFDFMTSLSLLVPASMTISLLQIINIKFRRPTISYNLYFISIPSIALGLFLADSFLLGSSIKIFISLMLLLSAIVKLKLLHLETFVSSLTKHSRIYHLIMGLVHGLTNLGGALLAILASNSVSDKNSVRYVIAHYYFAFTSIQLILILLFAKNHFLLLTNIYTTFIAAIVYLSIGNRIFKHTNSKNYNFLFAIFMASYAIILLIA